MSMNHFVCFQDSTLFNVWGTSLDLNLSTYVRRANLDPLTYISAICNYLLPFSILYDLFLQPMTFSE
jgi:hypothetical protein